MRVFYSGHRGYGKTLLQVCHKKKGCCLSVWRCTLFIEKELHLILIRQYCNLYFMCLCYLAAPLPFFFVILFFIPFFTPDLRDKMTKEQKSNKAKKEEEEEEEKREKRKEAKMRKGREKEGPVLQQTEFAN